MKICRFTLKSDPDRAPHLGVVLDGAVRDVTAITELLPAQRWPLPIGDQLIAALPDLCARMAALAGLAEPISLDDVSLLSPVANPAKFVCGAGNWKHHGAPFGMMGFMGKAVTSLAGPGEGVQLRWPDRDTVHEPELAIIIGKECSNISEAEALEYVAGYACALDMTLKPEREDWAFCKSFDSYGVIGPWLVTADEVADPSALGYQFRVNGELRGERSFGDLTGSPAQMIAYASTAMTLYPGDIVLSGAADVAPVAVGDVMTLNIPSIGTMETTVSISPYSRPAPEMAS